MRSDRGRVAARAVTAATVGMLYVAPLAVIVIAALSESLGARLRHVTLLLLMPYLLAAFSLSFALTDRGDVPGRRLTVALILVTLAVLGAMSLVPRRAAGH